MGLREERQAEFNEPDLPRPAFLSEVVSRLDRPSRRVRINASPAVAAFVALAIVLTVVVARVTDLVPLGGREELPVSHPITGILSYQFVSPDVGWISVGSMSATNVYGTSDGGATWTKRLQVDSSSTFVNFTPIPIQLFNARDGVVMGRPGDAAVVFVTHDGGATWHSHPVTTDPSQLLVCGYFIDSSTGWVLTTTPNAAVPAPPTTSQKATVYRT